MLAVHYSYTISQVLSIFDEERKKEAAEQRKGLCLAGLFPKPRPMWMAPAFVATFGDAFVEKSTLEVTFDFHIIVKFDCMSF